MKILVDTSFWLRVLRRKDPDAQAIREFNQILENDEVFVTGLIVQEILSHITHDDLFRKIEAVITGIGRIEPEVDDHVMAARMSVDLRKKGLTCGTIDLLPAAMAIRRNAVLLTLEDDFRNIAKHTKLKLYR
ncbi:MAG: PIN domain-containing protein [Planctomycetota bacterium]